MCRNACSALNISTSQRNHFLCILNGVFTRLGMNLTHPSLVLSIFVRMLGGSNTLIGLPLIRLIRMLEKEGMTVI